MFFFSFILIIIDRIVLFLFSNGFYSAYEQLQFCSLISE